LFNDRGAKFCESAGASGVEHSGFKSRVSLKFESKSAVNLIALFYGELNEN
jgi:hypothetical protein